MTSTAGGDRIVVSTAFQTHFHVPRVKPRSTGAPCVRYNRWSIEKDGLSWYFKQISSEPLLTAKQEKELALRFQENDDRKARDQLIMSNLHLVVRIARQHFSSHLSLGDLVSKGSIAMILMVNQFTRTAGLCS